MENKEKQAKVHRTRKIRKVGEMNFLYTFFCWCSGARLYILQKCPSDFNKFFGIGAIVVSTGIMAALSGGYAFFTAFKSIGLAIAFGSFWGLLIFFLDWYIVSSLKKENKFKRELTMAAPRIILAVFLAVVISKPLEMKLFESEISNEIETIRQENIIQYNNLVYTQFEEIKFLKDENDLLKNEILAKEENRNKLFDRMIEEAEGVSGTGKIGKGSVFTEKKEGYQRIEAELTELKQRNTIEIDHNLKEINRLVSDRENQISKGVKVQEAYDGFLARLDAFSSLGKRNKTIGFANLFIMLLFVCIEIAPVLVKLMSPRGPYDELLDAEEQSKYLEIARTKSNLTDEITLQSNLTREKNKARYQAEVKSNKKRISEINKLKDEITSRTIEDWKEKEISSLDNSPDNPEKITDQGQKTESDAPTSSHSEANSIQKELVDFKNNLKNDWNKN